MKGKSGGWQNHALFLKLYLYKVITGYIMKYHNVQILKWLDRCIGCIFCQWPSTIWSAHGIGSDIYNIINMSLVHVRCALVIKGVDKSMLSTTLQNVTGTHCVWWLSEGALSPVS